MRVNRRFLYWGIFLAAIGGVLVAADLALVDSATLTGVLRLWPLAAIAIGLSLIVRRTRWSLAGLVLAAAIPGIVLGAGFAAGPRFSGDCGTRTDLATVATTEGTFDGPADVSVRSACGSLDVTTAAGTGWRLATADAAGRAPQVDASARSLSIDASNDADGMFLDEGHDAWDLTLPTSELDSLSLVVNAGRGHVALPAARIGHLALTANVGELVVDASGADVDDVLAVVNVGAMRMRLPASDLTGTLRVDAGEIRICTTPGVGLRITSRGVADVIRIKGLQQHGSEWESSDYATATHRADLSVAVNFGAVEIDPIGGCS